MKLAYSAPELKKIDFNYKDQIVAQSPPLNVECATEFNPTPVAIPPSSGCGEVKPQAKIAC